MTGAKPTLTTLPGNTGLALQNCFIFYQLRPDWLNEFNLKPIFSIGSVVDLQQY
jgi:type IV secretion system protein VirD4